METKQITEEMFAQANAGEVILNLVREGAVIDEEIHLKVFALPDEKAAEILLEYVKYHWLSYEALLKVFALPDEKAAEIMLEYVRYCGKLRAEVLQTAQCRRNSAGVRQVRRKTLRRSSAQNL